MTFPYMTKNVIPLMTKNVVHCMTKKIVPRITKNLVLCMTKNVVPCVTSNVVPCMTKNNASGVFKNQSSVTHGSCRIILGFQQSNKASKFRKQIMQLLQSSWQNGRCTMHFFSTAFFCRRLWFQYHDYHDFQILCLALFLADILCSWFRFAFYFQILMSVVWATFSWTLRKTSLGKTKS